MYHSYFNQFEPKNDFTKEFISLWDGWLGTENYHKLDLVTDKEWSRFNKFITIVSETFKVMQVDCNSETLIEIDCIQSTLSNYIDSMNKDASLFSKYVLPELGCIITEEWDYTYILWHKNNGAIEKLSPLIKKVKLAHFSS